MNIPYPAVQIGPWDGGVNYAVPIEALAANCCSNMQNCEIGTGGVVVTRGGKAPYIDAANGTYVYGLGKQRYSSSSSQVWYIANAKYLVEATGAWSDKTNGLTLGSGLFTSANCGGWLALASSAGLFKATAASGNLAAWGVDSRFTTALIVRWYDNRAWWGNVSAGENYLYYSGLSNLESVGINDYFKTDGPITGVERTGSFLAVHNEDGIWGAFPTGTAATPYSWQKRAEFGAVSPYSLVLCPDGYQRFVRRDGIYQWDCANKPVKISSALDGSRFWSLLNASALATSHATVYPSKNQVWFWLPYGAAQATMNRVMAYDYLTGIWMGPYTIAGHSSACINDVPHCGGVTDGYLWKLDYGTDDNGTAIETFFETAAVYPQGISQTLRWVGAKHQFDRQTMDVNVVIQQKSNAIASKTDMLSVGDSSDALVTEFTIGSSALAGNSTSYVIDSEMWGWDSHAWFRYYNNSKGQVLSVRQAQALFQGVGSRHTFKTGVQV